MFFFPFSLFFLSFFPLKCGQPRQARHSQKHYHHPPKCMSIQICPFAGQEGLTLSWNQIASERGGKETWIVLWAVFGGQTVHCTAAGFTAALEKPHSRELQLCVGWKPASTWSQRAEKSGDTVCHPSPVCPEARFVSSSSNTSQRHCSWRGCIRSVFRWELTKSKLCPSPMSHIDAAEKLATPAFSVCGVSLSRVPNSLCSPAVLTFAVLCSLRGCYHEWPWSPQAGEMKMTRAGLSCFCFLDTWHLACGLCLWLPFERPGLRRSQVVESYLQTSRLKATDWAATAPAHVRHSHILDDRRRNLGHLNDVLVGIGMDGGALAHPQGDLWTSPSASREKCGQTAPSPSLSMQTPLDIWI